MPTQRDRIWSSVINILQCKPAVTVSDLERDLGQDAPARRTIHDCLASMSDLGFLERTEGQGSAPAVYIPNRQQSTIKLKKQGSPPASTSVFPYPGSKASIADWIVDHFPDHDAYVEPFAGSAGVFFWKSPSKYEILNDLDGDVVQFFRVLRDQEPQLSSWLRHIPYSRELYDEWAESYFEGYRPANPVERAGRFFTLRYMQFGGDYQAKTGFKARAARSAARTFSNGVERLSVFAKRLQDVIIESKEFREILRHYDDNTANVLFYIDPPYGESNYYHETYDREELITNLSQLDSKWMLSLDVIPVQLEQYEINKHEKRRRMGRTGNSAEYLISNFEI